MGADHQLVDAVAALWRIAAPGQDNLLAAPPFVALEELCRARYGGGKASFALHNALRSLGLPCSAGGLRPDVALGPAEAAAELDAAYRRKTTVRRHLCPLDLADDVPPLAFGPARVARFDAQELGALFDAPRMARTFPKQALDLERLAWFHWLVVEETVELDPRPEARAAPILFISLNRDFGEIDPHLGRFPDAVERALFFLLLAPWERWSTLLEIDWRGFRVPWIHSFDDDLFARLPPPPSPDTLSLEPWIVQDNWGEEIELERPTTYRLTDEAAAELAQFNHAAWDELEQARARPLFETPIAHFLVRAFLSSGIDEVMAHMTAIEAAVGLESDHKAWLRPKPDPHKGLSATNRVAWRLAAATNDKAAAQTYKDLFEIRSEFVHGRAGLSKIPTPRRVAARNLASSLARSLVSRAVRDARPRTEILADLLDRGRAFP